MWIQQQSNQHQLCWKICFTVGQSIVGYILQKIRHYINSRKKHYVVLPYDELLRSNIDPHTTWGELLADGYFGNPDALESELKMLITVFRHDHEWRQSITFPRSFT